MTEKSNVQIVLVKYPKDQNNKMKAWRLCQKEEISFSNKDWSVLLINPKQLHLIILKHLKCEIKEFETNSNITINQSDPFFKGACEQLVKFFGKTFTNLKTKGLLQKSGIKKDDVAFIKPIQQRLRSVS